jgi:hypothetical protein
MRSHADPYTLKGTKTSDRARDHVFLRVRSTCSASAATMGIQTVHQARHLFPEHCPATLNPMGPSPQRALKGKTAGEATDRDKCTLQPPRRPVRD